MNFLRIFKAAVAVITVFTFASFGSSDAQAKKHPSQNTSAQNGKLKKASTRTRRSRKKYVRNNRINRTRKRYKAKRYAKKRRVAKVKASRYNRKKRKTRRYSRKQRLALRKRKARLKRENTVKYSITARKRRHRSRHAIFKQSYKPGTIIVSFGDRRLYHFTKAKRVVVYPIGIPRKGFEWKGKTHVSWKAVNPRWTPTKRMREENPKLPEFVEGGTKANPLGVRALYLGKSEYRIHGTNVPWSIGQARSSGCIRMHNSHVIDLYNNVKPKAPVIITWKKFKRTNKYASSRFSKSRYNKSKRKRAKRNRTLRKRLSRNKRLARKNKRLARKRRQNRS